MDDPFLDEERIAAHVRISVSQMRKDFEQRGLSVARYIRTERVERARSILCDPAFRKYRIIDIAYSCGFQSVVTFNRAFRDVHGKTPSEVRYGLTPRSRSSGVKA